METIENTEETSVHDQEEMELAEEIIDGRKCANTKNQYRRKTSVPITGSALPVYRENIIL